MKILNLVYSLGKGGTERAAQNFATAYADLGHDSRVLFTQKDGPRREAIESAGVQIYDQGVSADLLAIADWYPEVIHLHSHGLLISDFKNLKHLFPDARFVETNVFSQPSPWVEELDVSFQLSQWCCWLYNKRSRKDQKSALVSYPVNTEAFRRSDPKKILRFREYYSIGADDIVIGRIGQNFPGKWSIALLDVYEKLRKNDARIKLLVVNPPKNISERLSKSPYKSSIVEIDVIHGDDELSVCYSAIDIFLLIAEQGESFGMVLAESLLCETPVVTLSTPWRDNSQGEVVGNGIGGLVATNKSDVHHLVKRLVESPELRKELGTSGRERILFKYDSHVVAEASLRFLMDDHPDYCSRVDLLSIMRDTEGKLGVISAVILRSNIFLGLLRFSTGYSPMYTLPKFIHGKLLLKIKALIKKWLSDRAPLT